MLTLHLISIDTGHECHAIRLAAEYWDFVVGATWVGNSQQIVDYFATSPKHDIIILSGHGDERGLLLPELDVEIQPRYPYNTVIRAEDFRSFLRLDGAIVLSLACLGGLPALADAFLDRGARAYIGPIDYLTGSAALMYALDFLYTYQHHGRDLVAAHQQAAQQMDDRQHFRLYQHNPLPR